MELTTLLLRLFGPVMLVIALGFALNQKHYKGMYKSLDKHPQFVLLISFLTLFFGVWVLLHHNLWGTPEEIVVSLIGWGALIKGLLLALMPAQMIKFVGKCMSGSTLPVMSFVLGVVGVFVSYLGYWAA